MTRFTFYVAAAIAGLGLAIQPAPAVEATKSDGNAGLGQSYARAACAGCHGVEATATSSPNIKAPPFIKMAKSAKLTMSEIDGWLISSHPNMPAVRVAPERRADLIAYIQSLAVKP